MSESTVTAPKRRRTTKKVQEIKQEQSTILKGFTPRTVPLIKERSITRSLSNSISSSAEIIEGIANGTKKSLKVLEKVCDYACVELDGLYAVSYTENLNKLVELGHTPENANAMLLARAEA